MTKRHDDRPAVVLVWRREDANPMIQCGSSGGLDPLLPLRLSLHVISGRHFLRDAVAVTRVPWVHFLAADHDAGKKVRDLAVGSHEHLGPLAEAVEVRAVKVANRGVVRCHGRHGPLVAIPAVQVRAAAHRVRVTVTKGHAKRPSVSAGEGPIAVVGEHVPVAALVDPERGVVKLDHVRRLGRALE
eukprot:CAMPEP_0119383856 /NCGR_PEP_ID=MMETSP1334-20130426/82210_1 /TAXON_ID=127549 /ORGANISM="Calcidiscus leptoporus, Strain RCC1130" /LENGTH=185 /DNA_ID=CAMNT_0007404773 /DNA_START=265 /DNA_END=819 /DNA_ORIENTATION=+